MSATSASHSTASSSAFLNNPRRRFENVTCLAVAFFIFFISIFSLAISNSITSCTIHADNNGESISTHKRQQHRLRFLCVIMENKKHVGNFQIKLIMPRESNPNMEKKYKEKKKKRRSKRKEEEDSKSAHRLDDLELRFRPAKLPLAVGFYGAEKARKGNCDGKEEDAVWRCSLLAAFTLASKNMEHCSKCVGKKILFSDKSVVKRCYFL